MYPSQVTVLCSKSARTVPYCPNNLLYQVLCLIHAYGRNLDMVYRSETFEYIVQVFSLEILSFQKLRAKFAFIIFVRLLGGAGKAIMKQFGDDIIVCIVLPISTSKAALTLTWFGCCSCSHVRQNRDPHSTTTLMMPLAMDHAFVWDAPDFISPIKSNRLEDESPQPGSEGFSLDLEARLTWNFAKQMRIRSLSL
jgi:hypothetical protein